MLDTDALAARIHDRIAARHAGPRSPQHPAPRVPDHQLMARIGGGSYGDVWLARGVTGRFRAVKVVWRQNFSSDRPYEREFRGIVQFEPISRSHPGVVNVLHVARDDAAGCFFYVMELADNARPANGPQAPSIRSASSADSAAEIWRDYLPRTPDSRSRAMEALQQAAALRPGLDLRNAAIMALTKPELRVIRQWNPRSPGSGGERPDPQLRRYSQWNSDGTISIHSMMDDQELALLPSNGEKVQFARFGADPEWLAVKYEGGFVRVWSLVTLASSSPIAPVHLFEFNQEGWGLIAGGMDRQLQLFDARNGETAWQQPLDFIPTLLAIHPSEPLLAVAAHDNTRIELRSATDGKLVRNLTVPDLGLIMSWSPDGQSFVTAHRDFSVRVWDWSHLESPRLILRLHRAEPALLAMAPGMHLLGTPAGITSSRCSISGMAERSLLRPAQPSTPQPTAAHLLANDIDWKLVELNPPLATQVIPVHETHKGPRHLAFSPEGRWIATAGEDGIRVLDRKSFEVHLRKVYHSGPSRLMAPFLNSVPTDNGSHGAIGGDKTPTF